MHSIQLEETHYTVKSEFHLSELKEGKHTAISRFEYCNGMVNLGTIKWLFSSRLLACSVISEILRESLGKCYISKTEYYFPLFQSKL